MSVTTSINRVFLGWQESFLSSVATYLVDRHAKNGISDLSTVVIALPGAHSMRRLTNLLVLESEKRNAALIPPRFLTPGDLCDFFLPSEQEIASPGVRLLAWISALKQTPSELLRILVSELPSENDFKAWLALAKRIDLLHVEIASAGLGFVDVAARGAVLATFLDEERWEVLEQVSGLYREILESQSKVDIYFDRIERLRSGELEQGQDELYLAGLTELNQNVRDLLGLIGSRATALIFAPESQADAFDTLGAIVPSVWENYQIPLAEERISVVEAPKDVVGEIYRLISELSVDYALSDISIGVGNESEVLYTKSSLIEQAIPARSAGGRAFSETEFGTLLRAVTVYLNSHSYRHFSLLIRHPVLVRMLTALSSSDDTSKNDLAKLSDLYQERHLQAITSAQMPIEVKDDNALVVLVEQLNRICVHLLGPAQSIEKWVEGITRFVQQLFPHIDESERDIAESFLSTVADLSDAESELSLKGVDALVLALQLAEELQLPDPHQESIELFGWLELAHDDAPVTILTGLDEGVVPAVINSDPFLPNSLRTHLGLIDNQKRLARDAFILTTLLESKHHCPVVVARRGLDSSPRFPSRLLLSCPEEQLPHRISHLHQEGKKVRLVQPERGEDERGLAIREPTYDGEKIASMSVTAFAEYIKCPYRFYLSYIKKAKECRSHLLEMDQLTFGTLTHAVLHELAKDEVITRFSPTDIFEVAEQLLEQKFHKHFGNHSFPAVRVQVEQLRERLKRFCYWQADWNRQGWKIVALEKDMASGECVLTWDSGSMSIRGRIDRIDYHEKTNHYRIIDYKSGDKEKSLNTLIRREKVDDKKIERWVDLQIPLYTFAARTWYPNASIDFMYVNISAGAMSEMITETEPLSDMIDSGIDTAREVARKVSEGVFWPPSAKVKFDTYEWLFKSRSDDESDSEEGDDE